MSTPPASNDTNDDDGLSTRFSTISEEGSSVPCGDIFCFQDPSAPPLSTGGSSASWMTRKAKDTSSNTSCFCPLHTRCCQRQQPPWNENENIKPERWKDERPLGALDHASIQLYEERPTERISLNCRTGPVIKPHRPMMSRDCQDAFRVQTILKPHDAHVDGLGGCCGFCRAPSSLPWCAIVFPCCSFPEELEETRRDSTYVVIRENAIEFNSPRVVMNSRSTMARLSPVAIMHAKSGGMGHRGGGIYTEACGCTYHVRDDARVVYFDDPVMSDVEAITDLRCGPLRRYLCGSRGQAVRVQSRACCGLCVRSRGLPCIPSCCICLCKPGVLSYDLPVKDAVDAAAKIKQARDNALTRMWRENDAHAAVPRPKG